jgi:hypothetical protein
MRIRHLVPVLALGLVFAVSACTDSRVTPIKSLFDDTSLYEGKTVRVAGEVTEAIGALGYGGYRLDDGTGKIDIIVQQSGTPRIGAKVVSEGTFRSAYTFGTQTLAAIVESRRISP